MAVNCERPSKAEEKKYHHNVAIAAVFDSVYDCLYFIAKTPQAEAKGASMLIRIWNLKKVNLVVNASCHTK